jgi:hypothetical protein
MLEKYISANNKEHKFSLLRQSQFLHFLFSLDVIPPRNALLP